MWLYKTGAPERVLGDIEDCGSDVIEPLLREAAKEFGTRVGIKGILRKITAGHEVGIQSSPARGDAYSGAPIHDFHN